jgi:PAS domain S-box-containing protein
MEDVQKAKKQNRRLIASVAPSAAAYFHMKNFAEMEKALMDLGFSAAEETSAAGAIVGLAHQEYVASHPEHLPVITSSCPVIINLVQQYHADLIPHLAPLVSPMIAHGRLLAQKYGPDAFIVFIGPCLAKKMEIYDKAVSGVIHAAMTFRGLEESFAAAGLPYRSRPEDLETQPAEGARVFPLQGGLIGVSPDDVLMLDQTMAVASGLDDCQEVLKSIRAGRVKKELVELMACKGGCVNRQRLSDLEEEPVSQKELAASIPRSSWPSLTRTFKDRQVKMPTFSEEQIQSVMRKVNKYNAVDELNCGACGYATCREKAIATLRGMAEATMCIPYMRHCSESIHQFVMDVAPNAIIIVDDNLVIHDMSPSAEKLLACRLQDVHGKHLSCVIAVLDDFLYVRDTGRHVVGKACRVKDDIVVEQTIGRVDGQPLMVAILRDITEREKEREKSFAIREEMLERTREVVRKQMRVAHEIAHLLGETAAESKTTLTNLTKLIDEEFARNRHN